MRQASLIGHVIEIYSAFAKRPERPADLHIRNFFSERKYLGSKDRRFIADAYFGTIKNYLRLEAIVRDTDLTKREFKTGDPFLSVLTVAAYFIAVQELAPDEMNEALFEINLPFANEFVREHFWAMADRHREIARLAELAPVERLATAYSFPAWFVQRLEDEYGEAEIETLLASMNEEAETVLRANKLVVKDREELAHELAGEGCQTSASLLAENGLRIPRRINVLGSKAFKRGAFEIQDEASQLVAPLAGITDPKVKVLDACAGAGGKTLHFSALLENKGEIYATDIDGYKIEELKKRLRRSTSQNVRIIYPERREEELKRKLGWFDVVLLDVPCSGTGTLRRNPGIKWVMTEKMLEEVLAKQKLILDENAKYVKPGGVLLYATCSVLKEEGESQVEKFLSNAPDFTLESTLRTRPDKEGCDGFYAARIRKANVTASG
jgi:16S rRNA (cytosine967-C5)-methyltransferase